MKCPICGKYKELKQDMINHIEDLHRNDIPDSMSTAQFLYTQIHGRSYGLCRVCGKRTPWNEKAGKPSQLCGKPSCKAVQREKAYKNMIKVYGKPSLLNDPIHQQKMLANRKISGTYIWSDGKHKFTYTGSYEKFTIEWLDKVMQLNPDKIQMPGPIIPYTINGETKNWLTDIYLEDFNLIIEVKDGGDSRNTHPGFAHNRELESAKDDCMRKQNQYNYIKLTNRDVMCLLNTLTDIRLKNIFDNSRKDDIIIAINESWDEYEKKVYPNNVDTIYIILCSLTSGPDKNRYNGVALVDSTFKHLFKFKNKYKLDNIKLIKVTTHEKEFDFARIYNTFINNYYDCSKLFQTTDLLAICNKVVNDICSYPSYEYKDRVKDISVLYDGKNCSIRELSKKIPEVVTDGYFYKNNDEIDLLCETFMDENTIADLSPIIKSASENSNDIFKFGNGLSTIIPTGHDYNVVQDIMIKENDEPDQKFSAHPANNTPDPFILSNNFIMKEIGEIRADIQNDPAAMSDGINNITKEIYSNNFIV